MKIPVENFSSPHKKALRQMVPTPGSKPFPPALGMHFPSALPPNPLSSRFGHASSLCVTIKPISLPPRSRILSLRYPPPPFPPLSGKHPLFVLPPTPFSSLLGYSSFLCVTTQPLYPMLPARISPQREKDTRQQAGAYNPLFFYSNITSTDKPLFHMVSG